MITKSLSFQVKHRHNVDSTQKLFAHMSGQTGVYFHLLQSSDEVVSGSKFKTYNMWIPCYKNLCHHQYTKHLKKQKTTLLVSVKSEIQRLQQSAAQFSELINIPL